MAAIFACPTTLRMHSTTSASIRISHLSGGAYSVSVYSKLIAFASRKKLFTRLLRHSASAHFSAIKNHSSSFGWTSRIERKITRACSSSLVDSGQSLHAEAERAQLKAKLYEDLAKTSGNLTDVSLDLIASLESLNPTPAPTAKRENFVGDFLMLNSTTQDVLYKGATVTAGRLTFNVLQPVSLKLTMEDVYNYLGLETENAYNVEIQFTVAEEGLPPVQGKLLNRAEFQVSSSQRLDITFLSSSLAPQNLEKDLQDWLKIFKEANPEMDDQGLLRKDLPGLKGWIDLTYMDDELRINRGNFGNIVVLRRLGKVG